MSTKVTFDKGIVTVSFPYNEKQSYPASSTGKMLMVATSNGFVSVPGTDIRVSFNAGKSNPDAPVKAKG